MTPDLSQRLSAAAHRDLPHANPLSVAQFDALVRAVAETHPRSALDIGCGPGTFAIALAQACDAAVIGVDINADFLARARSLADARTLIGQVEFRDASAATLVDQRHDAVACIGASHAFGTPRQAVARCANLLTDGGVLLFADCVWTTEPPQEFLDFLGTERDFYWRLDEAGPVFADAGLVVRQQALVSAASWQAYEDAIHHARLRFADTLGPDDAAAVRTRAATWTAAWQRWGRESLGFVATLATRRT